MDAKAKEKAKATALKAKREKLAVKHWLKFTDARIVELEMVGLSGAAKAIAKIIRGR